MVKENVVLFTGKSDGLTWEKFDDSVVSWGRKKFGDAYAMALWKDELMNLRDLDMTDDLVKYAFEDYCDLVYDMLVQESPKYASDLYHDRRFWTPRWQIDNKQRQREKMFCHLEEITGGEVKRQLKKRGVHMMNTMRAFFFNRFGAGQPDVLAERTALFLLGMPDRSGEVFPPRVNMEDKLNELETEREYLLEMCPVEKRDEYNPGKILTLVRLIIDKLLSEFYVWSTVSLQL